MTTPLDLLNCLADELREATKNFKFVAQYQPDKKISIYIQAIPKVEFESQTFYPLICVELLNVEDHLEDGVKTSIASVLLTVGTYQGERTDGWRDHLNLIEYVRQFVLTHEVLGKRFPLLYPTYLGLVEPRSDNFLFSNIFVQYLVGSPSSSYCR